MASGRIALTPDPERPEHADQRQALGDALPEHGDPAERPSSAPDQPTTAARRPRGTSCRATRRGPAARGSSREARVAYALSEAVAGYRRDLGGENGRLGCPTAREAAGASSPQGSADRVATFGQNGVIVLAVSGPRAGEAFAVSGGCYRLYVQYGGTSGWLGLPTADQENTPDGATQHFEGGVMRWGRALNDCDAEPSAAAPPAAPTATAATEARAPLDLFETHPTTGDRGHEAWRRRAASRRRRPRATRGCAARGACWPPRRRGRPD